MLAAGIEAVGIAAALIVYFVKSSLYSRWHPAKQKGVSVSSFILPERVTVFTSPVSWLERTQNC